MFRLAVSDSYDEHEYLIGMDFSNGNSVTVITQVAK